MIDVLPDTGVEKETGKRFFPSKRKSSHCERTEGMSTINSLYGLFPHAHDRSSSMPFYNIRNFLSFRQGFALVTKYKWQLVYLAGRTVRCLASMYDKPLLNHSRNVTHPGKYDTDVQGCDRVDSLGSRTMLKAFFENRFLLRPWPHWHNLMMAQFASITSGSSRQTGTLSDTHACSQTSCAPVSISLTTALAMHKHLN